MEAARGIWTGVTMHFASASWTKVVRHARYVTFQLAEVAVPRRLYRAILERIRRFAALSPTAAPIGQVRTAHQPNKRRGICDVNRSPPLPKRPDRASRPPSWGRTRPVTVDSGQKQANGTWDSRGGVTLVLGKLGGGAGRRSNGRFRLDLSSNWLSNGLSGRGFLPLNKGIPDEREEDVIEVVWPCSRRAHAGRSLWHRRTDDGVGTATPWCCSSSRRNRFQHSTSVPGGRIQRRSIQTATCDAAYAGGPP